MAYERHDWAHGEVISEQLLDNIEEGISEAIGSVSSKADKIDTILDTTLSRGRKANTTVGVGSFAFGSNVEASGVYSHAEGSDTTASGSNAHAEGSSTIASEDHSHAEGLRTTASGLVTHAEGMDTVASGDASHAEGNLTTASGYLSHAEGQGTLAIGQSSHVFGEFNVADAYDSWNEWVSGTSYEVGDKIKRTLGTTVIGYICKTANSDVNFVQNNWSIDKKVNYVELVGNGAALNARSNARALDWNGNEYLNGNLYVGCNNDSTGGTKVATTVDIASKADKIPMIGATSLAAGVSGLVPAPSTGDNIKFLRGDGTWQDVTVGGAAIASLIFNGVEYQPTNGTVIIDGGRAANTTIGTGSFAFGSDVEASGDESHAEGMYTIASGGQSHAEGFETIASGDAAHVEGAYTIAEGAVSHAEGMYTITASLSAHAEGYDTVAAGSYSHVVGKYNVIDEPTTWNTYEPGVAYSVGDLVKQTETIGNVQIIKGYRCSQNHTGGAELDDTYWDKNIPIKYAEIVGNGTATNARSNARALDWDGNEHLKGTLYTKCSADSTGGYQVYDTSMIVYSDNPSGPANPVEGMIWLKPE